MIRTGQQRIGSLAGKGEKDSVDLTLVGDVQQVDLQSQATRGRLHVRQMLLRARRLRIDKDGDGRGFGHELTQEFESLGADLAMTVKSGYAGRRPLGPQRIAQNWREGT